MYCELRRIYAAPQHGVELAALLTEGMLDLAGCISFLVKPETGMPDVLWISQRWESRAHFDASQVQQTRLRVKALERRLVLRFETPWNPSDVEAEKGNESES